MIFLDTGFVIALASPRDRYHDKAVQLADDLKKSGFAIITTRNLAVKQVCSDAYGAALVAAEEAG